MYIGKTNYSLKGLGDISSDFSQISTDLMAGNFSTAFSDPVNGIPAWAWLAGGLFLYMFMFSGGEQHSRFGRAKRAARRGYQAAASAY